MSAATCPTCGGPLRQRWQGRPAVYCGTPCRQAAHRARQAAARAAETARWLRASMGSTETEIHRALNGALAALAAVHDVPLPGEYAVHGGFEDDLMHQADAMRRAWSRVHDLARDHARARDDCAAARSRGFRNAEASAPEADETAAGLAGHDARTERARVALEFGLPTPAGPEPSDRTSFPSPDRQLVTPRRNAPAGSADLGEGALADAVADVLFGMWPRYAALVKRNLSMANVAAAVDRLYEAHRLMPGELPTAAAALLDAAEDLGRDRLPAEFDQALTRLAKTCSVAGSETAATAT